ncbi:hypothetical protein H0H93_013444 [Arthromyces matolae]|nr:hypothetical protein H0H93_013444 [Arthromyces matolae]
MTNVDRIAAVSKVLLDCEVTDAVWWGDHALSRHGIPTVVMRDDIALNENDIAQIAVSLTSNGWRELLLTEPPALSGFWLDGWVEFMRHGRRFKYPEQFPDVYGMELVLLPRSFLGLEAVASTELQTDSDHPCLAYPSARLMAQSIAEMFVRSSGHCALIMRSWAAYFIQYNVLKEEELDQLEGKNTEFWRELRSLRVR